VEIDFGKTSSDYGRYRAGFPERFFDRLFEDYYVRQHDHVLDLGTGTGTVARGLAARGCLVTGLDPSPQLIEEAKHADAAANLKIDYILARAEDTGLPSGSFEVVTAGQCWHWFDRARAASEAWSLLKSGGTLIIAHFDWLPLPGNVVEATEQLILAHNPSWTGGASNGGSGAGGAGIHPLWLTDVATAGFKNIETFSFDVDVPYRSDGWRGRIRASAGITASLTPEAVEIFDGELASLLATRFPNEPLAIPHRVWAVTCRKKDF
jgi:SAM-dependent methyltransferase